VGVVSVRLGLFHAVGLALGGDDDGVVQEPVEEADGGGVLGEEPAPFFEGPVRSDAECPAFVGGCDEPEQELGGVVVERRELGRGQDALWPFGRRFSCPRPPNRTCPFPSIRLSTCGVR
jgi:hypothetical protein